MQSRWKYGAVVEIKPARNALVLGFAIMLTGCESEESCYKRLNDKLSSNAILNGIGLELVMILHNDDLSVCDYTVHMDSLIRK